MGGSGCEVSTLPHLQHGAVTNYTMAGDTEVGRDGWREGERGRERGESPIDTERVQVRTLVTHARLILHSKIYIDNSGAILTTKYTHTVYMYMYMHT